MEKFYCLDLPTPPHQWPGYMGRGQGAQSRRATWGRCKPPRFSRNGLASGWWGTVSKYLLLYLTCSQRNHGDAQQQAAFPALRARAQTVPPSHGMDPEHEVLWGHRLSDIHTISTPLLRCMYREATDRTQHLRAKAISEARMGIDDWVRQHAEKGNKRLHAWVRGVRPPRWSSRSQTMAGKPHNPIAGLPPTAPRSPCPILRFSPTPARFSSASRPPFGTIFGWRLTVGIVG